MAEEIDFENGRNSNFEGLLTLTFDPAIRHIVLQQSSTSTYIPNFIQFEETFCGRTYGWTYGRADGHFPLYTIRSTFGSRPNNNKVTCRIKFNWWVNSAKQNRPDSNLNVQIDPDRLTGVESQVYDYRLYAWLSRWPECQVLVNITVRMMTNCE